MLATASSTAISSAAQNVGKYMKLDQQTWDSVKQESKKRWAGLRAWTEFFDRSRMSKPVDFASGFKLVSSLPANEPSKILGLGPFTQSQAWAIYGLISVIMFFFSGATSSLFWVVMVCGALVSLHGGFMDKPLEADFADAV